MTKVLKSIPFKIDIKKLEQELMLSNKEDQDRLFEIVSELRQTAVPCAMYREVYISEKGNDYLLIDNIKLESRILRKNVGDHDRVFLYAVTVGKEVDQWAKTKTGILESYWVEQIQIKLLNSAINYLYKKLDKLIASKITAEMNPGSLPDWPIEEQIKLFTLIGNVEDKIGLKLTDSYLMLPAKSISGLKFPTDSVFKNCNLCKRDNCPTRRAEYNPKIN